MLSTTLVIFLLYTTANGTAREIQFNAPAGYASVDACERAAPEQKKIFEAQFATGVIQVPLEAYTMNYKLEHVCFEVEMGPR